MILDTSQLNQKLARSKICQIFYLVTADTFLRVDLHQNAEKESVFIIRFIKSVVKESQIAHLSTTIDLLISQKLFESNLI